MGWNGTGRDSKQWNGLGSEERDGFQTEASGPHRSARSIMSHSIGSYTNAAWGWTGKGWIGMGWVVGVKELRWNEGGMKDGNGMGWDGMDGAKLVAMINDTIAEFGLNAAPCVDAANRLEQGNHRVAK
eukprot:gene10320-441_t